MEVIIWNKVINNFFLDTFTCTVGRWQAVNLIRKFKVAMNIVVIKVYQGLLGTSKVEANQVWMTATSLLSFKCTWFSMHGSHSLAISFFLRIIIKNRFINRILFNNNQWLRLERDGRWATLCFTFLQLTPQTEQSASLIMHFNTPIPQIYSPSLSLCMYHFFHPLFVPFCANSVPLFPSHATANSIFLTPDISFTSLFILKTEL